MASLKYTGDIDLSRNKILNILKIQGSNLVENLALSNDLEISTADETSGNTGSLTLRSGNASGEKAKTGNVYIFAGAGEKVSEEIEYNGITVSPENILLAEIGLTDLVNHSIQLYSNKYVKNVGYLSSGDKAFKPSFVETVDSTYSKDTETRESSYLAEAYGSYNLKVYNKGNANHNFSVKVGITKNDETNPSFAIEASKDSSSVKATNLQAVDTVSSKKVTADVSVTVGKIKIEFDEDSSSLRFVRA